MHFKQIGKNRYRVEVSAEDDTRIGTVEKQEYDSINASTGERVTKRFWRAHGHSGGWKAATKKTFPSREDAAKFLIKDSKTAYADREMQWTKRQGESAALKEAKA